MSYKPCDRRQKHPLRTELSPQERPKLRTIGLFQYREPYVMHRRTQNSHNWKFPSSPTTVMQPLILMLVFLQSTYKGTVNLYPALANAGIFQ